MIDLLTISPQFYERDFLPTIKGMSVAADRITLLIPSMGVKLGAIIIPISAREILLSTAANWDDAQYATATNRAGKDFYIYVTSTALILSANSIAPTGYSASTATQIGGFHCLCLSVGVIAGHAYTGFLTGDILPSAIWDMRFRPACSPRGMFYSLAFDIFVDIYMQSGTGVNTLSAFGATITDTRMYWDHADDFAAVGKRLLTDLEFSVVAYGSPEAINILGSADPVTTGGHIDTASRRIISNLGAEDAIGVMYQWVDGGHIYRNDDAAYIGGWSWKTTNGQGQQYTQGSNGAVGLLAGGAWYDGSFCGSRCRSASSVRTDASSSFGSRGCARRQG